MDVVRIADLACRSLDGRSCARLIESITAGFLKINMITLSVPGALIDLPRIGKGDDTMRIQNNGFMHVGECFFIVIGQRIHRTPIQKRAGSMGFSSASWTVRIREGPFQECGIQRSDVRIGIVPFNKDINATT